MKKVVIAYSGGLDTSYCAKYLSEEENFEVHAVSVNTGGFSEEEIEKIGSNAKKIGAATYKNIDAVSSFYNKVVKYLIYGNVLKNNTYPLSVSAERIVQALEIINYAKETGAEYIAHGSTGAGNDQVRFDMIFQLIAPNIKIITPIRDKKTDSPGRNRLPEIERRGNELGKSQIFGEQRALGNQRGWCRNADL